MVLIVAFLIMFLSAIVTPVMTFLIMSRIDFQKRQGNHVRTDYMTSKERMA